MSNTAKYESYKLALRQVRKAIQSGYYLEAVTIEESLLSDRLWSTLNVGRSPQKRIPTLGDALEKWHPTKLDRNGGLPAQHKNARLFAGEMEFLYPALHEWWKRRCVLLHGIGKSPQGQAPEIRAEVFPDEAAAVARFGLWAFRYVDDWVKRQIKKKVRAPEVNVSGM